MMTRTARRTSVALAAAMAATTLVWSGGVVGVAGAATANFSCTGIDGDLAGSVAGVNKSSKQLLELLASLGGSAELALPVDVTVTAPSAVTTGAPPYAVSFAYKIALPDSLVTSVKSLLGLNSLTITDASFGVDLSGAATGSIVGSTASTVVSLATSPVVVNQDIAGTVTPTSSGLVYYRPGAAKLSVVVNGEVAGTAKIGTITVQCAASGLLGSTTVKPAGAPNIPVSPIIVPVTANASTSVPLDDGVKVVPDQGNPITWSSLKLSGNASGGTASAAGGSVAYTAPAANGTYDASFEICAASKTVTGSPGATEVQTLNFVDPSYYQQAFNKHPLFFTLTFDGQETAPIMTSVATNIFGFPVPYDANDEASRFLHNWFGQFQAPTPTMLQNALEALPNVGPGDIVVTGGPTPADLTNPYTFTFAGALAKKDVAQVGIAKWVTWLPNEALAQILAAAQGLGGGGTPGVVPPTFEESLQAALQGLITADQMLQQWGDRAKYVLLAGINVQEILDSVTSWFPKIPAAATTVTGEPAIPDSETGPLCSQGVIQFVVTGGTDPTTTPTTAKPVATTVGSAVRSATLFRPTSGSTTATGATAVASNASYTG